MDSERGEWRSRIGFVLAAAGSAVGLGNIWKFPYLTGQNAGAAFLIVDLVLVLAISRAARRDFTCVDNTQGSTTNIGYYPGLRR